MRARGDPLVDFKAHLLALLEQVGGEDPLLVGVSGGSDSMALVLLAHETLPGRVAAVTVDHGLRRESADEARAVSRWCKARAIAHRVLRWKGTKPATGIAARAREARYALLAEAARGLGTRLRPATLLTAHTLEDQAETFAMRLAHGSDVAGLAAMRPISEIAGAPPVPLLRPLLSASREDLRGVLRARGQTWIEDSSNEDLRFERIRIRRALAASPSGPSATTLAHAASLFARLEDGLETPLGAFLARTVRIEPEGFARLSRGELAAVPPLLLLRGLRRLVHAIGGGGYPPRRAAVEALMNRLRDPDFAGATLAGCRFIARAGEILMVREWRRGCPACEIAPGAFAFWDRRFFVWRPPETGPAVLTIAPLGRAGRAHWRDSLGPRVPAAAAGGLPGLFDGRHLRAAASVSRAPGEVPAALFAGLARVERRLCAVWSEWTKPASDAPILS